jgi:hypothetical protein
LTIKYLSLFQANTPSTNRTTTTTTAAVGKCPYNHGAAAVAATVSSDSNNRLECVLFLVGVFLFSELIFLQNTVEMGCTYNTTHRKSTCDCLHCFFYSILSFHLFYLISPFLVTHKSVPTPILFPPRIAQKVSKSSVRADVCLQMSKVRMKTVRMVFACLFGVLVWLFIV